jgi:hypothetical protein
MLDFFSVIFLVFDRPSRQNVDKDIENTALHILYVNIKDTFSFQSFFMN